MIKQNSHKENSEYKNYQKARVAHGDYVARKYGNRKDFSSYYHERLGQILQFVVPPGQRVIEIGCGRGDLLASLKPLYGVGVDFSGEMIKLAKSRHSDLHFIQVDADDLDLRDKFDFVILSDIVNELWDVQSVFQKILTRTTPRSRIVINFY